MALLWGFQCAVMKSFLPISICSNNQQLVELVKGNVKSSVGVGFLVQDIRDLSNKVREVGFNYCKRTSNRAAHYLATQGLSSNFNCQDHGFPSIVTELCLKDYSFQ